MTAVFFGSAVNNFGVQLLLDGFLDYAPPPGEGSCWRAKSPRTTRASRGLFSSSSRTWTRGTGTDRLHEGLLGRFERDMKVFHPRTGTQRPLSSSHRLFGQEREIVNEAYAGDIVGLVGHSEFGIGDTLTVVPSLVHQGIPRFMPEHFAYLHFRCGKMKRFRAGLDHLLQEGVVQTFALKDAAQRLPLLGAVGPLQFERCCSTGCWRNTGPTPAWS